MAEITREEEIQLDTLFGSIFGKTMDKIKIKPITDKFGVKLVLSILSYLLQENRKIHSPYGYIYKLCKK